jgi:hypothetical protein
MEPSKLFARSTLEGEHIKLQTPQKGLTAAAILLHSTQKYTQTLLQQNDCVCQQRTRQNGLLRARDVRLVAKVIHLLITHTVSYWLRSSTPILQVASALSQAV